MHTWLEASGNEYCIKKNHGINRNSTLQIIRRQTSGLPGCFGWLGFKV
ncbi:MAG: hypothetical protein PHD40_05140 [Syntrophomonadaceae bacterium]|nr:hypothetical protein [Syntrophomonadaceae bacterium]